MGWLPVATGYKKKYTAVMCSELIKSMSSSELQRTDDAESKEIGFSKIINWSHGYYK